MIDVDTFLVTNEHGTPVAVQIRYEDWLRLEGYLAAAAADEDTPDRADFRSREASSSRPGPAASPPGASPTSPSGAGARRYEDAAANDDFQQRLLEEWAEMEDVFAPRDSSRDRSNTSSDQSQESKSGDAPSAGSNAGDSADAFDQILAAVRGSWTGEDDVPDRAVRSSS